MATLNLVVAASADDAQEFATGSVSIVGTTPTLDAAGEMFGARWAAAVPQGATIDSATFSVYVMNTSYDDPVTDVYGFDEDTTAAFTTTDDDISDRPTTTATVAWDGTGVGTGYIGITVTSIVQEIVDRVGWSSGNYMGLVMVGDTGTNVRVAAYDGDPAKAAKLDITYTEASGVPRHAMYYARLRAS